MEEKMNIGKLMLLSLSLLIFSASFGYAQSADEVSDEELMKYAVVEDSVERTLKMKQAEFNAAIQASELLNGGRLYVEIKNAKGDENKLAELGVSEEAMEEFKKLNAMETAIANDVRELKVKLVQDKDILGVALYNKVNKAVKENAEVKAKFDQIMAELRAKNEETTDTSDEG
jgi:hypothetical protein